jgi:hypothetical protein
LHRCSPVCASVYIFWLPYAGIFRLGVHWW